MINHITFLRFKENLSESEKRIASVKLKSGFEGLAGKIDGMANIKVENILLETSNVDLIVTAQFETKEALNNYHTSPLAFNFKNTLDESLEKTYIADYIA
ncbi:MAG: Dabb family protein [Firmicutes bacterium]|nr:Dabb family protein [[Eubacterium] siraeum]MCM1487251.1 Dabb family protein [Bacillota bacterium]